MQEELRESGWYRKVWQGFAVLLPLKTVGVMGDGRTYEHVIALRVVDSVDAMTADWARLPADLIARMSGRITATMMRKARRYAILAIFVVAAILTPPDVVSQLLMACPMLVLYELSILVAATFGRKKTKPESEENAENQAESDEKNAEEA